jgi:quinol monooxygenase YgiN
MTGPGGGPDAASRAGDGPEVCLVIGEFTAAPGREQDLGGVLARYAVLTRAEPGCRNVDLALVTGEPRRFVVVEKWADHASVRSHLDGPAALRLAADARALLAGAPRLQLCDGISAHDLT